MRSRVHRAVRRVLIGISWTGLVVTADASSMRPASGADLPGTAARPWQLVEWEGSPPLTLGGLKGRVVVVRFWTNTCPYCARSLPALQSLADELKEAPVQFVGVYHSKPRGRDRAWKDAVAKVKEWGVRFPIAYDRDWKTVDAWWLDGRADVPTSATFVIGADGVIAHVHPGPELHPSTDPEHADCARDFTRLRRAIDEALAKARTAPIEKP
jgi:thiol-disulfide isomerase/thioredoxin